jgi:endonuclease/exonuclease/phosphatase family metal-dependent hydrolase
MNVCLFLAMVLPGAAPASAPIPLRVMTYNIHHGAGLDKKIDINRIALAIREQNCDVVCLQEVDRNVPRSGLLDMPALFAERLGMTATFEPSLKLDGGEYGNCTLTKWPIDSYRIYPLPAPPGKEPRACLSVTFRIGGRPVTVLNTHFGLSAAERKEQAAEILLFECNDVAAILAGDLNEMPPEPAVQTLLTRFKNATVADAPERTWSFSADKPDRQIDYVLASDAFDVLSSRVISTPVTAVASDHLPWVVDLRLKPEPPCLNADVDTDVVERNVK